MALLAIAFTVGGFAQGEENAGEEIPVRQPLGVDLLPPLSLRDAESLANRAQLLLEGYGTGSSADDLRLARLMLQCVTDHIELTAQRRLSLTDYQWVYLGRDLIPQSGVEHEFTLEVLHPPLPMVQALKMDCTRELIEIRQIVVNQGDDDPITIRQSLTLDPDVPGHRFVYLPQGASVTSLTVTASALTWEDGRPRLRFWLGQSPREEHLLQALYHLGQAGRALGQESYDASVAELELARQLITDARENQIR